MAHDRLLRLRSVIQLHDRLLLRLHGVAEQLRRPRRLRRLRRRRPVWKERRREGRLSRISPGRRSVQVHGRQAARVQRRQRQRRPRRREERWVRVRRYGRERQVAGLVLQSGQGLGDGVGGLRSHALECTRALLLLAQLLLLGPPLAPRVERLTPCRAQLALETRHLGLGGSYALLRCASLMLEPVHVLCRLCRLGRERLLGPGRALALLALLRHPILGGLLSLLALPA